MVEKTTSSNELERWWKRYKKTSCQESRNLLLEHYLFVVKNVAAKLYTKFSGKTDFGELVSSGVLGLMDAVEAFDLDRGVRFETFSPYRIRGKILDDLRDQDWVPRLSRTRHRNIAEAARTLKLQTGRTPDDATDVLVLFDACEMLARRNLNEAEKGRGDHGM